MCYTINIQHPHVLQYEGLVCVDAGCYTSTWKKYTNCWNPSQIKDCESINWCSKC